MSNPFFILTRSELIFLTAIFLLGVISGGTLLNLIISQQVDRLILERNELQVKVREQQAQIENMEKKYGKNIITKISIKLETDLNKHTQQDLTAQIHKHLSGIMGKEINKEDLILLIDIIDDRYLLNKGNTYHIRLNHLLVVWGELMINLDIVDVNTSKQEAE